MANLRSIDLRVAKRLRVDSDFRREWFRADLETSVPEQICALREARGKTQAELAEATAYDGKKPMKQSAISRFERSTSATYSFPVVLRLAEALDGVVEVRIRPAEEVIDAIEAEEECEPISSTSIAGSETRRDGSAATGLEQPRPSETTTASQNANSAFPTLLGNMRRQENSLWN